jgi:hypothetical protein
VAAGWQGRCPDGAGRVEDVDHVLVAGAQRGDGARVAEAAGCSAKGNGEDGYADVVADRHRIWVVVFAQSFHWTDRDRVAATVLNMLEPGGAFVHMSDLKNPPTDPQALPLPHPAPPFAGIRDLVARHLGPVRRAGQGTLPNGTPDRADLVLANAGFENFTRHIVPAGQVVVRSADDIVAWVFSRSDSAPHLLGDRLGDFERDLRALLRQVSPDGMFAEHLPPTEIMTWRKPG